MSLRAVIDTMIMYQWAVLPKGRQHGLDRAVDAQKVRQILSPPLFNEIVDLLGRPAIRAKAPHLTDERAALFASGLQKRGVWFQAVPDVFTLPAHPKDDHLFNLAIASDADYIVTWETRLLEIDRKHPGPAARFRALAPAVEIVTPREIMDALQELE